jgi:hypothetical protein
MIFSASSFDHFDGLVQVRVEWLTFGGDGPQAKFLQRILQLLVNEFNACAQLRFVGWSRLQRALKAIQDRKKGL